MEGPAPSYGMLWLRSSDWLTRFKCDELHHGFQWALQEEWWHKWLVHASSHHWTGFSIHLNILEPQILASLEVHPCHGHRSTSIGLNAGSPELWTQTSSSWDASRHCKTLQRRYLGDNCCTGCCMMLQWSSSAVCPWSDHDLRNSGVWWHRWVHLSSQFLSTFKFMSATLTFAQTWMGHWHQLIFKRDQNPPPPVNNMLNRWRVLTSAIFKRD